MTVNLSHGLPAEVVFQTHLWTPDEIGQTGVVHLDGTAGTKQGKGAFFVSFFLCYIFNHVSKTPESTNLVTKHSPADGVAVTT